MKKRTLRAQADAALALNPDAKRFIADEPCNNCQTFERSTKSTQCCKCKYDAAKAERAGTGAQEKRKAEFEKRLNHGVDLVVNQDYGICAAAKIAHCTSLNLSRALKQRNYNIPRKRPVKSDSGDMRQPEFAEARWPLLAGLLMDNWYRGAHGKY